MTAIKNPFLVQGYVSPEYFCDREEETEKLVSAVLNGRNVTLISPRRMGKSGLIHNTFYKLQQENPEIKCFYLDIYATNNLKDFTLLLGQTLLGAFDTVSEKILTKITTFLKSCRPVVSVDSLSGMPTLSLDMVAEDSSVTLKEIFDYLKECGQECVIAIDEFQQIEEYPESGTEALLRSYIQFLPNVHFIFSGSRYHIMENMFFSPKKPFYRSTQIMSLDKINEDSYYEFARKHLTFNNIEISRDSFDYIYNIVKGHTWHIQRILNKIYAEFSGEITISDVNKTIKTILEEEEFNYQKDLRSLTQNQQNLLKAIAKEEIIKQIHSKEFIYKYNLGAPSSIDRALASLIERDFVLETIDGYEIYDRFMGLWLKIM